jgi:hypothetical protein
LLDNDLWLVVERRKEIVLVDDIPRKGPGMDHLEDFQTDTGNTQEFFNDLEMVVGQRRRDEHHFRHLVFQQAPVIPEHHQHNHPLGRLVVKLVQHQEIHLVHDGPGRV